MQAQYSQLPPSLAQFSPTDPDIIVYTGYGMNKVVQFYSLTQKKVQTEHKSWVLTICMDKLKKEFLLDGQMVHIVLFGKFLKLWNTGWFSHCFSFSC